MNKDYYRRHIRSLTADDIAKGIRDGIVTFKELQDTEEFEAKKQKIVKEILLKFQEEDRDYNSAITIPLLLAFQKKYPESQYYEIAKNKINLLQHEEKALKQRKLDNIKKNIKDSPIDEILKLDKEILLELCLDIGLDYDFLINFTEPPLQFNDIPQNSDDIPSGYTDVFFWGIPSSGKTCALAAILGTIKKKYTMAEPEIEKKFGATYRNSLANIFFRTEMGYLPDSTRTDRTQYMPFHLKRREESDYRKISFFELSGEVFRYFYEVVNHCSILRNDVRDKVVNSFETLKLLLNSKNQKIHFFFIDYNKETRFAVDSNNLTQGDYLASAANFFHDNYDILKKKTNAVYVVVTKADEIKGENTLKVAEDFLDANFGGFMDFLERRCKKDGVKFFVKIFSIGDVYFNRICRINRDYATAVIDNLLTIKASRDSRIRDILNS